MVGKIKNQKRFIQIPFLVTIIAGVLVLGGAGYLGVRQYQSYQTGKIEKEKTAQEIQQQKDSEVEKLKEEVEALKKQQSQQTIQPLSKKAITSEVDEGSKIFNEWAKRTVKVTCSWKGYVHLEGDEVVYGSGEYFEVEQEGSGTIFFKRNGQIPFVFSNSHIVVRDNQCVIAVPDLNGGFYYYDSFAVIPSKDLDIAEFFLPDESTAGMKFGPIGNSPSASTLMWIKNYKYCMPADVQIGDKVYILGYPAIGGETITMTEGIISGYENNFYKTSAKIDEGNSGGVAVLGKKNCYLGIPTSAAVGEIESLGRILDLTYLEKYLKD